MASVSNWLSLLPIFQSKFSAWTVLCGMSGVKDVCIDCDWPTAFQMQVLPGSVSIKTCRIVPAGDASLEKAPRAD